MQLNPVLRVFWFLYKILNLANKIEELITDPGRCASMGQAGRKLAENSFDEKEVVSKHLKIYRELTNNYGPEPEAIISRN